LYFVHKLGTLARCHLQTNTPSASSTTGCQITTHDRPRKLVTYTRRTKCFSKAPRLTLRNRKVIRSKQPMRLSHISKQSESRLYCCFYYWQYRHPFCM